MSQQILYVMFLALSTCRDDNPLSDNLKLKSHVSDDTFSRTTAFEFFLGDGSEDEQQVFPFVPVLGKKTTIVGNVKTGDKWGIDCGEKNLNECKVTDKGGKQAFWNYKFYNYQKASVNFRLSETEMKEKDGLPIELVNGGQNWTLDTFGILGLHPQSEAIAYFKKKYQGFNIFLEYATEGKKDAPDFVSRMTVNYKKEDMKSLASYDINNDVNSWYLKGSFTLDKIWTKKNDKICITNSEDNIIITSDTMLDCDRVREKVCDGETGLKCNKAKADLSKVPDLVVNLDGTDFRFEPEKYIWFRKMSKDESGDENLHVECRFGDPEGLRSMELCERDTELAIGKMFFQSYAPLFTVHKNGSYTLSFYKGTLTPDSTKWWTYFWFAVGALILILIIVILCLSLKKKKAREENIEEVDYERVED